MTRQKDHARRIALKLIIMLFGVIGIQQPVSGHPDAPAANFNEPPFVFRPFAQPIVIAEDFSGAETRDLWDADLSNLLPAPPYEPVFNDDHLDVDMSPGLLSYSQPYAYNTTLITAIQVAGFVQISLPPNENGTTMVSIDASDIADAEHGTVATGTYTFMVTVTPSPDQPFVASPLADDSVLEDSGPYTVDVSSTFDDVDITREGDGLTLTVANPDLTLFSNVSIAAGILVVDLQPNAVGSATITITAMDTFGLSEQDSFVLTVTGANDAPFVQSPIG
ncbi:MAG: hypothetical protein O7H39_04420, partial [Gammaproteobacteria bacterium]|nr:hypothetical protein [Gammaproteobacteria bacterium]